MADRPADLGAAAAAVAAAAADVQAGQPGSRLTVRERHEEGRSARKQAPRDSHAGWQPAANRADPVALLEASNGSRVPELVPIRYGRMAASPFAFFRGSATVMAHDLATTPTSGIAVQACGDAHLLNFGLFATPERHLVFDVNDFDETLPGPWEWDVKRLAASAAVAARQAGFGDAVARSAAEASVEAYHYRVGLYAGQGHLDAWYSRIDVEMLEQMATDSRVHRNLARGVAKARRRTALQAMAKLTTVVDGRRRLVDDPPLLEHVTTDDFAERVHVLYEAYAASLPDDRRHLLDRYRFMDVAFKVVGVGSVGTRCFLVLFQGVHDDDVLMLQLKEAERSVLEPFAGDSAYDHHGRRVVEGQRLMQAASDIFLGWGTGAEGFHFYFRQFRDMKGSFTPEGARPQGLTDYVRVCGWALARAHARSGNAAAIAGYLGRSDRFVRNVGEFAMAYADQTHRDHAALVAAIAEGRVEARAGV
ncbi:MAG: DUF2252 domain-containing protein [Acidimicrobiales bacterium]